ncbi:MerR family transcriptional regulator [Streptomyces lasiicapitis]|uniref:MerR family transcriptional regulator n=1 Tax=Streptomyces lasiicapitis TaxID=1923961 RepID=A0ABQ2M6M4_9ACTN|nr:MULTISPECIES: MerR family transcriptional regulator [Streptomyces]QIB45218.1 MerR family transcriptional regulator [Streptomyces aureoverticillatus]GGO47506.1 MerR family transcriptional regulator [Streptomyces lasiicapitis]
MDAPGRDPEPRKDPELLSIGAFAARTRLSAKALRLYDRQGLLPPAYVDDATGYRYYRPEQVERARTVVLLRRLDMPLADIAAVVGLDGEGAARAVGEHWARVEERFAAQRTLVDYLRGRMSGRSPTLYGTFEIRTTDVPEAFVLVERRHVFTDELPAWIDASLARLERAAMESCGGVAAAPFVIYHAEVTEDSDGPAEVCVPVADPAAARAWAAEQGRKWDVRARVEPAHRLAYTRITKAQVVYPQIIGAYDAVEAWLEREGLTSTGPCREVYFAEWDAAGPGDQVCDVAYPVG